MTDTWKMAESKAAELHAALGVEEHHARCTIVPTSDHGYRITVIRLSDGATRTAKVG